MTLRLLALVLASVSLSALAQLCLKLGVGAAGAAGTASGVAGAGRGMVAFLTSPLVLLGLALYGFGALLWLYVLARLPLSAAYPFVGLGFVMTMAIGYAALGEAVGPGRIAGTLLIAAGCVLVARSVG
jgi:multidrug transporter EmrE-like cation transporter